MPACPGARAISMSANQSVLAFSANSTLSLSPSPVLFPAGPPPAMTRLGATVSIPVPDDGPPLLLCVLARLASLAPSPAPTQLFPSAPLRLGPTFAPPVSLTPSQIMLLASSMSSTLEIYDMPPSQAITNRFRMFMRAMFRFTRPCLAALSRSDLQPLKGPHLSATPPPCG